MKIIDILPQTEQKEGLDNEYAQKKDMQMKARTKVLNALKVCDFGSEFEKDITTILDDVQMMNRYMVCDH